MLQSSLILIDCSKSRCELVVGVCCSGEKDHYFVDMADDVVRGSVVSHEVNCLDARML